MPCLSSSKQLPHDTTNAYLLNPLRKVILAVAICVSSSPASTADLMTVNAFTKPSTFSHSTLCLPLSMMPMEHIRDTRKQVQVASQMSITPKVKILSRFKQIMGRLISIVRRGLIREPVQRQFRHNQIQRLTLHDKRLKRQVLRVGNKRPVTRR